MKADHQNYKFWQDGNHPIELNTNELIDEKAGLYS